MIVIPCTTGLAGNGREAEEGGSYGWWVVEEGGILVSSSSSKEEGERKRGEGVREGETKGSFKGD